MSRITMVDTFVLDASALLCLLKGEAGAERVLTVLPHAWISAVHLFETYAHLADLGGTEERIAQAIEGLHLRTVPFDALQARAAGMLQPKGKTFGLSLSDCAALALARQRGATAMTTHRAWTDLAEPLGVVVELVG
jgi:ribonuclease VapC